MSIKTYIVFAMRAGMEVWFPSTPEEKRGVARLDGVVVDALRESHGIARSHPICYSRRNLKALVLLCDFGLPSMRTEDESALVRFYYHNDLSLAPPPPATLLTLLPAHNPWRIHL
jgi:hypothetical protein